MMNVKALCVNFVLQATNAQGLGTRLGDTNMKSCQNGRFQPLFEQLSFVHRLLKTERGLTNVVELASDGTSIAL